MAEIKGYYGASDNPCIIITYGGWYVVEGSTNVNFTYEEIKKGINVESIIDMDTFQADEPVYTEEDLIREIEDKESDY
jgi:hypothetical protein